MESNRRPKGQLRYYMLWPFLLAIPLIFTGVWLYIKGQFGPGTVCMTAAAIALILAGVLYAQARNLFYSDLARFFVQYETQQMKIMKQADVPLALALKNGTVVWMNDAFLAPAEPSEGHRLHLQEMAPVGSKCFPGHKLDATAYKAFISENRITRGIIVGDKGFPESAAHEYFAANPELHYLNPVKRNSKLIERHNMLDFTGILPGYEGITFRKEKCTGTDKWLYSFRNSGKAAKEEQDWLRRAKKNKTYSLEALREKQKTFGTIVLECDLDLPAETAYKAYDKRWEIEIVMRFYKSACEFDETHVQDDYSVIGSEFCDFLSTLLTFRLIKAFDRAHLLEDRTYKKIMSILTRAKKARLDGEDWNLIRLNPSHEEILQELGLLPKPEEPPKKIPGRPKGSKNKSVVKEQASVPTEGKRKRGRPKGSKNKPKNVDPTAGTS